MSLRALFVVAALLSACASGLQLLGRPMTAAPLKPRTALPSRPAQCLPRGGAAVWMAAAEAEPEEPAEEPVEAPEASADAAETQEPAAKAEAKVEEEEDDLLNSPAFLKQKLKVLEKELEKVLEQTEEATAEAAKQQEEFGSKRDRLNTDLENFKARHYNATLEKQLEARVKLIEEFLPVLDNFDRARGSIDTDGAEQEATNARYQDMHAGLMASLEAMGVAKVPTVGTEFDYNQHMAIQQMPSADYDENVVCDELQPGYTCEGKLVRAAYVMVSMGS